MRPVSHFAWLLCGLVSNGANEPRRDVKSQIAKFMGPTWGPPGSCRPHMGHMLAPWTLLSGAFGVLLTARCSWPNVRQNCEVRPNVRPLQVADFIPAYTTGNRHSRGNFDTADVPSYFPSANQSIYFCRRTNKHIFGGAQQGFLSFPFDARACVCVRDNWLYIQTILSCLPLSVIYPWCCISL